MNSAYYMFIVITRFSLVPQNYAFQPPPLIGSFADLAYELSCYIIW
jgi:hypothetical protein